MTAVCRRRAEAEMAVKVRDENVLQSETCRLWGCVPVAERAVGVASCPP